MQGVSCPVTGRRTIADVPDSIVFGVIGALLGGAAVAIVFMQRQSRLTADRAALEAGLAAARQASDEQKVLLTQSQEQLRDAFASLSQDALREIRQDFLQHAGALFQPVRETLNRVQDQLITVDRAREGSFRAVATQLTQLGDAQRELRDAAENLTRSLRSPNARGRWGELQLRRIVELAGLTNQCDFEEKPSSNTDSGRQTPDLIVRLPGNATVVIDAKVPIDGYLNASEAETDVQRQRGLEAHARQVRDHMRALGSKEYWKQFETSPEFVIMFLPWSPCCRPRSKWTARSSIKPQASA